MIDFWLKKNKYDNMLTDTTTTTTYINLVSKNNRYYLYSIVPKSKLFFWPFISIGMKTGPAKYKYIVFFALPWKFYERSENGRDEPWWDFLQGRRRHFWIERVWPQIASNDLSQNKDNNRFFSIRFNFFFTHFLQSNFSTLLNSNEYLLFSLDNSDSQ